MTDEIAPDYSSTVLTPMCFQQIEQALQTGHYDSAAQFRDALLLVFANCMTYNITDAVIFKLAAALCKEMRDVWAQSVSSMQQ